MPVAYVELKPGATATAAELMKFAQEHIGERAAIPKEIMILDKLPLTAVGKLFKPTLVFEQVEKVFREDLAQIPGIDKCEILVEGDKRLGTVAKVTIDCAPTVDKAALEAKVKEMLGHYTVKSTVVVRK